MAIDSFLNEFRQTIVQEKEYKLLQNEVITSDFKLATQIQLHSGAKFLLTSPSGYKQYDCKTLLYFYIKRNVEHATYCRMAVDDSYDIISFMDRKDLLDYLTGVSKESEHLKSKKTSVDAVKKELEDAVLFGFNLNKKRSSLSAEITNDVESVKRMALMCRTVNTPYNILCVKGQKHFANIEKPAFNAFITKDEKKEVRPKPVVHQPETKKKSSRVVEKDKNTIPIIIIPAAAQSVISLYNVEELLIKQNFVAADEFRKKGIIKPASVIIKRDPKKYAVSDFLVLDSIDSLKPIDWKRVVGVFTMGQEWQFRSWKWDKPVDIFSNTVGFSLTFQDEPLPGLARGPKKHLKRLNAPKHWMLSKLTGTWAPKPSAGPHKTRECLPLIVFIRNRLRYALTNKETKAIVMQRLIKVDGKVRTDMTYPAGFMDVISIEKTGENFRLIYDVKGRFAIHRITEEEAKYKLCKVKQVKLGAKAIPYAVTHDGRTLRYPDPLVKVNDTVKIDIETGKIVDFVKFDNGNVAYVTGGNNLGRIGVITHREKHIGGFEIVHIKDALDRTFATRIGNVFIIGKGSKPWVSLPKGKGVKLTIAEERDRRRERLA
ncbi:40S ribosomal protein S4, X isoform [Globomyces sp. JEL0801]|nr:40S ribosomal protein S4, X isoform [Globomyces sp. JEL0801]